MLWFNGQSSDDFGLRVEHSPNFYLPERKVQRFSVPGRNGDVFIEQDAWENYVRSYDVYITPTGSAGTLYDRLLAISNWLNVDGYKKLEDTYNPGVHFRARFNGGMTITNYFNKFGRAKLNFDCDPRKFLASGETPIVSSGYITLANPTAVPAYPLIQFRTTTTNKRVRIGGFINGYYVTFFDCTLGDAATYTYDTESMTISEDAVYANYTLNALEEFRVDGHGTTGVESDDVTLTVIPRWAAL